jgi:hypothetical protein
MTVALPKTEKVAEWNRFIQDRVQGPLRPVGPLLPETLGSVLIIVPGSSGDVILATTVVRYIKDRNPQCRVSFAVKRSNLPLVALCPGVDEAVEWPKESPINPRSRRLNLARNSGQADVVLYPICDPEDMDLLLRYNFLETIWLLAGIPDGLPPEPQRLWINPPDDPDTADRVLHRCFGRHHAAQLLAEVSRQPGKPVRTALRDRKVRNAGWKLIPRSILRLLRNAAYVGRLGGRPAVSEAAEKLVIVSSEANMFPPPTRGLFEAIIRFFRAQGRVVLQNVLDPAHAAPGTIPLICSYREFLCLRSVGIPFVGWRSGLCDIAATTPAPMCTVYPSSFAGCGYLIQATMEKPTESFGFAAMNIATTSIEIVCDTAADLDYEQLATILKR